MNDPRPDPELDALFALARQNPPDTSRAEYAFETRLMARLRDRRPADAGSVWARVAWRMLPIFAALVVALGVWANDLNSAVNESAGVARIEQPESVELLGTVE